MTRRANRPEARASMRRVLVLLLVVSLVPGCAWWGERSTTTKGAVYGSGAGAATGAAIGAILGGGQGAWKGAAIGAAVGGLGGGAVGYYMDQQKKEMQDVVARQDRVDRDGDMLRVSLSSDVLFDSGSAQLQPGGQDKLGEVSKVLTKYPRTRLEIVGHTDNRGTEASNQTLSERRAQAVRDVLVRDGVDASRITLRGEGAGRPVATNATPEGRAQNRRVEILSRPDEGLAREGSEPAAGAPPAPAAEPR
jgi:outer membrane protein OmpA-like peptidoglycan-associated protein